MRKELKIIHFITSLQRGGRERQLCTIYKYNSKDDHRIRILYLNGAPNNYINEFNISNSDLIKIRSTKFLKRLIEIYFVLKKEKPDIVFAWGSLEVFFTILLKPLFNYVFINASIRHGIVSQRLGHRWRTLLLHFSKNIIANSQAGLKANFLKRGAVLYNGVDNIFFSESNVEDKIYLFRKTLMAPVFISVANLVPYKDYATVVCALAILKQKGFRFSYLIIGEGPARVQIENQIKSYGLTDNIFLIGSAQKVNQYLKISDVFIHSSKGEGCSNAIIEAMASGLAIIATNTGGTNEIVNKSFGRLFEYKNCIQLSSILIEIIQNLDSISQMGKNAKKHAKNNFSAQIMLKNYYQLINQLFRK